MFFYLLSVLFAYYILKPVSRSMFLTKFDVDKLPYLYILIAVFGGIFAYLYSKLATRSSLSTAVFWTMLLSVASLVAMWALVYLPWMVYVLNIWVSLFSIVLVSQGWLVASNLFNAREAKRLYPLLGMGMVLGAAFGGEFTNRTALLVGTRNLMLASAAMVIVAYTAFRFAITGSKDIVKQARAGGEEQTDFSFREMVGDVVRIRHLQVIVGIMVVMYLVDTMVEWQLQFVAAAAYRGDRLTAFFGQFYGLYLNLTEAVFQLFFTAAVVKRFGVGGTLQISPVSVGLSSVATAIVPGVWSAGAVRLTEASTRYTLNRTGMELLYMPLPRELRNRIKAFIDICVDRLSRGLGGVLLLALTGWLRFGIRGVAAVVMVLCIPWVFLSHRARKEYIATVRRRFEKRRLDFEGERIIVTDAQTISLLEGVAAGDNPRQASYALSLLADAPRYDVKPLLQKLARSPLREVRDKVYETAGWLKFDGALEAAVAEIRAAQEGDSRDLPHSAVPYAVTVAPDRAHLAAELLDDRKPELARGVLDGLRADADLARQLITPEWLEREAQSSDPARRALAATGIGVRGDHDSGVLHGLLEDSDDRVASAASGAAAVLRNPAYTESLIRSLGRPAVRGEAIGALAAYGPPICDTLAPVLLDDGAPARIRQQIPRVLKNIHDQRAVDVLLKAAGHRELGIRAAVLKALNRLRESAPGLNFDQAFVTDRILNEARYYFELNAALAPFRGQNDKHGAATLLARTIEQRLKDTLERLFRLLGLRYPPKEIYAVYLAFSRQHHEDESAALEFLDNVLDPDLKRILLPLLDAPENLGERGRELFGVQDRTAEEAIRELIHSRDPWLVACAMAAAAELKMRSLAPEIAQAAEGVEGEVSEVARSAEAALAA